MPGLDPNSTNGSQATSCRTCTDFKSWAKQQNVKFGSSTGNENTAHNSKVVNFMLQCLGFSLLSRLLQCVTISRDKFHQPTNWTSILFLRVLGYQQQMWTPVMVALMTKTIWDDQRGDFFIRWLQTIPIIQARKKSLTYQHFSVFSPKYIHAICVLKISKKSNYIILLFRPARAHLVFML